MDCAHRTWVDRQEFGEPALQDVLDAYRGALEAEAELRAAGARLSAWAGREPPAPAVAKLGAYRGIAELTALTLAAEVVDWHRFATARAFMGFTGLIPSEYSSGTRTRRGSITKAGPEGVRTALVEAAWSFRYRPAIGALLHPAGRSGPGHPGPLLESAAAPARHLEEDDRPRQALRRRGHGRGPRARRVRLGRDDRLTSREASHQTGGVPGKRRRGRKDPRECFERAELAVSEGHRPAPSRPAIPTREYEPGSGDNHDLAPARRPYHSRPRRHRPGFDKGTPAEPPPGNAGRRGRPGGSEPTGSRPLSNPSLSRPCLERKAGAHATRPARHAARRQRGADSEDDPHQQRITVPAKVDRPFHMSIHVPRLCLAMT